MNWIQKLFKYKVGIIFSLIIICALSIDYSDVYNKLRTYKYTQFFLYNNVNAFSKNLNNISVRAELESVQLGNMIMFGESIGTETLLEESMKKYSDAKAILSLDLASEIENVKDKLSYVNEFQITLEEIISDLSNQSLFIQNRLDFLLIRDGLLRNSLKDIEDQLVLDFRDLKYDGFSSRLQDEYFDLKNIYMINKSYLNLYKKLSLGYENILNIMTEYKTEIALNKEPLVLGVKVIRFDRARLNLIIDEDDLSISE